METLEMMTERQAADALGKHVRTLSRWRRDGYGPRYLKIGGRFYYRREAIEAFVSACEGGAEAGADVGVGHAERDTSV